MAHPNIPGGYSSEEARQKAEGKVTQKYGINTQGTTVSNNAPVGAAGQPASSDASSQSAKRMPPGKGKAMSQERSDAIERRMKNLRKGKK